MKPVPFAPFCSRSVGNGFPIVAAYSKCSGFQLSQHRFRGSEELGKHKDWAYVLFSQDLAKVHKTCIPKKKKTNHTMQNTSSLPKPVGKAPGLFGSSKDQKARPLTWHSSASKLQPQSSSVSQLSPVFMFLTGKQGTQYDAYNNFCLLSSHIIPGTDRCKDALTVVLRPAHLFFYTPSSTG